MHAPPRPADCSLDLVEADITSLSFNQTWDVLGYVTFVDEGSQDPMSEENRELARPRACKMGGTSIAIAMNSTSTNQLGQQGSGVTYMVLRAKASASAQPTAF